LTKLEKSWGSTRSGSMLTPVMAANLHFPVHTVTRFEALRKWILWQSTPTKFFSFNTNALLLCSRIPSLSLTFPPTPTWFWKHNGRWAKSLHALAPRLLMLWNYGQRSNTLVALALKLWLSQDCSSPRTSRMKLPRTKTWFYSTRLTSTLACLFSCHNCAKVVGSQLQTSRSSIDVIHSSKPASMRAATSMSTVSISRDVQTLCCRKTRLLISSEQ